jgi:hypothetical protein
VGQELLDTPKWMGSLYGDYQFLRTTQWTADFRAEYQYHGANLRQFESLATVMFANGTVGTIPDGTQVQSAYHVVNATFNVANGPMQYRLYIDNLTNASPFLDFRRASGVSSATTIRPRTIGIGVKASF